MLCNRIEDMETLHPHVWIVCVPEDDVSVSLCSHNVCKEIVPSSLEYQRVVLYILITFDFGYELLHYLK